MIKTYSDLLSFDTLEERYEYLRIGGTVGFATFGHERYLNQQFYTSSEWRRVRQHCIARDLGNDLGVDGHPIHDKVVIHHMNPISPKDIHDRRDDILDLNYLISVSHRTHNAIHYGDASLLPKQFVERSRHDTRLWGRRSHESDQR